MDLNKDTVVKLIRILGRWLICSIILYGMLPDAGRSRQEIEMSIIIGFLLSVYLSLRDHLKQHTFFSLQNDKENAFPSNWVNLFLSNWILFGLIYYSLLNNNQKTKGILGAVLYGGLVALGFMGGRIRLKKKWDSLYRNKKRDK